MRFPKAVRELNFDIDNYINPWLPPNQLHRLPNSVSRFLGHRATPRKDVGNILVLIWSFIGAFAGIAVVDAVFKYSNVLESSHPPMIIASFGASAVLEYGVIGSPLGQPRNCLLGHLISAFIGVGVTKLFKYSDNFEEIKWLAGSVSVGLAASAMSITNTSHPPGGATALLAAIDPEVSNMGWALLPYVLIGTSCMLGVALIINNIQRQFPIFWWTPRDVGGRLWPAKKATGPDLEALEEQKISSSKMAIHQENEHSDTSTHGYQSSSSKNSEDTADIEADSAIRSNYSHSIQSGSERTIVT